MIYGRWISVEDDLPEAYILVLVAYADRNSSNKGIGTASIQSDGNWLIDSDTDGLLGEFYSEEESVISHWSPYQEWLKYLTE